NDLFEALEIQMPTFADHSADTIESLCVNLLGRHQRIRTEVGEHSLHQVTYVPHFVLDGLVGSIRSDESAFPSSLKHVEKLGSVCVLADRETRSNLPTVPMSSAWLERNAETAFAIYEPGDVRSDIHGVRPEPACYAVLQPHPRTLNP